jgi:RNA-directed DNA polymerase
VNTGAPWPSLEQAEARVLGIQTKLHQWATGDPNRRFDDLYNLVCDPAFLLVAWHRVRGNKGARTAGVDGQTVYYVERGRGVEAFLADLRAELKARRFAPLPVRERLIPKSSGKLRRLGIATIRDRVVQAALKLVLEPIFEADMLDCSFGFRPRRAAHDGVQVVVDAAWQGRRWVVETDIADCFSAIPHSGLLAAVTERICDRKVLALLGAFLRAGVMQDGSVRRPVTGTPQGGVISPVLCNVYLHRLDRAWRGAYGTLVRYADDRAPRTLREVLV